MTRRTGGTVSVLYRRPVAVATRWWVPLTEHRVDPSGFTLSRVVWHYVPRKGLV